MKTHLILAVEPDRRQSSHLTHIVRRLGAELILAEAFEHALPAIGSRVPDLILVPALLSPEDDAALRFVLRVISGTSHVQVLTTPLFEGATQKPSSRGLLPGFLRARTVKASDGCDPDEFARHIKSYLDSAAEKRASGQMPISVSTASLEPERDSAAPEPERDPEHEPESVNGLAQVDAEEFESAVATYLQAESEKLAITEEPQMTIELVRDADRDDIAEQPAAVVAKTTRDESAFDRLDAE